jgi:alkanesulfonate monooxygenase SsuD/methylene tetrahydromethanopterin reductase-like flavin-dependent oxidoreductase (luciferase family)
VILGVGAGWLAEEFAALDVPFETRGARFDAYMDALRALWTADGPTSLRNDFVTYDEVYCKPQPVNGTVPLHVGGHSRVAARRAGRLGDGFFPGRGDLPELLGLMREAAEQAGRDPDAIEVSASATPGVFGPDPVAAVEELASQGVDRIMIPPLAFHAEGIGPALAAFGENVISKTASV